MLRVQIDYWDLTRTVPLIAFQHVSKHAGGPLNQFCPQLDKEATQENRKNVNFTLIFLSRF